VNGESETVKMGGEVPFILRICPDSIFRKMYRCSGVYNPEGMLVICIERARRS
jgi:hypothetical protein